jgi:hypothetical protein
MTALMMILSIFLKKTGHVLHADSYVGKNLETRRGWQFLTDCFASDSDDDEMEENEDCIDNDAVTVEELDVCHGDDDDEGILKM